MFRWYQLHIQDASPGSEALSDYTSPEAADEHQYFRCVALDHSRLADVRWRSNRQGIDARDRSFSPYSYG